MYLYEHYSFHLFYVFYVFLFLSAIELLVLELRSIWERQFEFHYFPVRKIIQEETIQGIFPPHFSKVDKPNILSPIYILVTTGPNLCPKPKNSWLDT